MANQLTNYMNIPTRAGIPNDLKRYIQMPQNYIQNQSTGQTYDLGPSQAPSGIELDFASGPVEIAGYGKGYRAKNDPLTVYDVSGKKLASLGNDIDATRKRQADDLKLADAREELEGKRIQNQSGRLMLGFGAGKNIPSGYRMTQDGNLEAIPGGPADLKMAGQYNQDTAQLQSAMSDLDRLATSAHELLSHPGLNGITGIRGALPNIPGTDAADAQAKLNTLKSQVGFGVLQAMRNASKTGGALGNVSDAEGKRLESNLAALDNAQSLDQFKQSLTKIKQYADTAKDNFLSAYNLKHGQGSTTAVNPQAANKSAPTVNAKGWILHADANGNKAYVSPDGKQFEEVK